MKLVTRLTVMFFVMAAAASALLYNTSYKVQDLRQAQRALDADIVAEQNAIRVLQAEWAYLAEPGRIERLAATHLAMKKIDNAKAGVRIQTARSFAKAVPVQVAGATKTKTAPAPVKVAAATATQPKATAKVIPAAAPVASQDSVQLLLASFRQQ